MRRLPRAVAAGVLGALAGATWLVLVYTLSPGMQLNLAAAPSALTAGFFPAELGPDGWFVWTTGQARVTFDGLNRRSPWTCTLRVRGARPDADALPLLTVTVDGTLAAMRRVSNTFEPVTVDVPPHPADRGLVLGLAATPTFVPGGSDPRELGVMLGEIGCRPAAGAAVMAPPTAVRGAGVAAGLIGAAVALTGVTPGSAIGAAVVAAAGQALPLASGTAPYSGFAATAVSLAFGVALTLALGVALTEWGIGRSLRNTARFVAIFSAAAAYFKLLLLLHPDLPPGAIGFSTARLEALLSGHVSLGAVPPGGPVLPDGLTLYLIATPLAWLVENQALVLRVVAVAVEAAAGLWLYGMVNRAWSDRLVGAGAVALFHLVPVSMDVLATSGLSLSVGHSLAVVTMALIARSSVRLAALGPFGGLTTLMLAAFLSGAATLTVLAATGLVAATLYAVRGEYGLQSVAHRLALSLGFAAVAVGALYVAATLLGRPSGTAGTLAVLPPVGEGRNGGAGVGILAGFGGPLLLLAALGGWRLIRARLRDRLSLTLAAWLVAPVMLAAAGRAGGVEVVPAVLAASAPVATLGAVGAAWLWHRPTAPRVLALALLGWSIAWATRNWIGWL